WASSPGTTSSGPSICRVKTGVSRDARPRPLGRNRPPGAGPQRQSAESPRRPGAAVAGGPGTGLRPRRGGGGPHVFAGGRGRAGGERPRGSGGSPRGGHRRAAVRHEPRGAVAGGDVRRAADLGRRGGFGGGAGAVRGGREGGAGRDGGAGARARQGGHGTGPLRGLARGRG